MSRIEISKRLIIVNSASAAVRIVLMMSVLVWLNQYLLRRITPEEYALLPIVMALMAFEPIITILLTGGVGRFVTVAYARGQDNEVTSIVSTMLPILCVGSIALLGLGWTAAWHIEKILTITPERVWDARVMLILLVFETAVRLPAAAFGAGFMIRQKLVLGDAIDVATELLRIVLLLVLLLGVSTRVLWVVVASVSANLVNLAVTVPISRYLVPAQRFRWSAFKWPLAREITSYNSWQLLDQVAKSVKVAMDPLILNQFATAWDVASFHLGGIVPRQMPTLITPISRPFIPVLGAMFATGDYTRFSNTYLRTARYNSWLVLTLCIPAATFGRELMLLYAGDQYAAAGVVMAVLLVAPFVLALNALGQAAAHAAGEMRGLATRTLTVQVVNLGLTFLFVAYLQKGALGSAMATALSAVGVDAVLLLPFAWRVTKTPPMAWVREVALPTILPAIASVSFCFAVKHLIGVETWLGLFAASGASAVVYLGLVLAFGLRQQDRIDLARLADRVPYPLSAVARRLGSS